MTEYGAIDAASVDLRGGALSVYIAFALTAEEYVFDLIASSALDGIRGDFASIDLLGLGAGYLSEFGTVWDDPGGGPAEIHRLTLTRRGVSEPASLLLLAAGLLAPLAARHQPARPATRAVWQSAPAA